MYVCILIFIRVVVSRNNSMCVYIYALISISTFRELGERMICVFMAFEHSYMYTHTSPDASLHKIFYTHIHDHIYIMYMRIMYMTYVHASPHKMFHTQIHDLYTYTPKSTNPHIHQNRIYTKIEFQPPRTSRV